MEYRSLYTNKQLKKIYYVPIFIGPVAVCDPLESVPNERPSVWCRLRRQNKTKFCSEAKER